MLLHQIIQHNDNINKLSDNDRLIHLENLHHDKIHFLDKKAVFRVRLVQLQRHHTQPLVCFQIHRKCVCNANQVHHKELNTYQVLT